MTTLTYSFGDSRTPTQDYSSPAEVDVNGDGHPDGVYLDFDGSGHRDSIAWDSDGDGKVDTILVSSHHDGVYDTAYYDPSGNGHWDVAEPIQQADGTVESTETGDTFAETSSGTDEVGTDVTLDHQELTYSFGDSTHATHTYHGEANVDVNGDGHPDGIYLDFDGSGHHDSIAWDSDGDGKVDTILVSSHHDGVYDTAYHDPSGNGHWNDAEPIDGSITAAGVYGSDETATPPPPLPPAHPTYTDDSSDSTDSTDHIWSVGGDDDPYAHVATHADEPSHDDLHLSF